MNVFISGGCKNGKSYYAQRDAKRQAGAAGRPLYYIATMIPHDEEDHAEDDNRRVAHFLPISLVYEGLEDGEGGDEHGVRGKE